MRMCCMRKDNRDQRMELQSRVLKTNQSLFSQFLGQKQVFLVKPPCAPLQTIKEQTKVESPPFLLVVWCLHSHGTQYSVSLEWSIDQNALKKLAVWSWQPMRQDMSFIVHSKCVSSFLYYVERAWQHEQQQWILIINQWLINAQGGIWSFHLMTNDFVLGKNHKGKINVYPNTKYANQYPDSFTVSKSRLSQTCEEAGESGPDQC